jgi:hypothetical protein
MTHPPFFSVSNREQSGCSPLEPVKPPVKPAGVSHACWLFEHGARCGVQGCTCWCHEKAS